MKSKIVLMSAVLVILGGCTATSVPTSTESPTAEATETHEAEAIHWSYTGEAGPENWGELSEDFALCSTGSQQSPIDIATVTEQDLANITFDYRPSAVTILNNGHTVQVNYDAGSSIELDGVRYDLLQFHFHAPSEHSIDGTLFAAEFHFVHRNADGGLAVIGVMVQEGQENPAYVSLLANLPAEEGEAQTKDDQINALEMLPAIQTTYRYAGSLTTPPCSEGVAWNVMTEPVEMSAEQLALLTDLFEGNNRPVQDLDGRTPIEDTSP